MHKFFFTMALVLLFSSASSGQKRILVPPVDSAQIKSLYREAAVYIKKAEDVDDSYADSTITLFKNALRVSESQHMRRLSDDICLNIGTMYLRKNNLVEGNKWIAKGMAGYKLSGDEMDEADALLGIADRLPAIPDKALYLDSVLERVMNIYRKKKQSEKLVMAMQLYANNHNTLGMYTRAESEYLVVIDLLHSLKINKTSPIYLTLSVQNRYNGDFEKSISYTLKCLQQTELGRDTVPLIFLYGELGLVYDGLGQIKESIYWYHKALIQREKTTGVFGIFRTAGFLIQQMIKLGQQEEALSIITQLAKKHTRRNAAINSIIAQNRGYCYEAMKDYRSAELQYLEMIKQTDYSRLNTEETTIAYKDIGSFYCRRHQYNKAKIYLKKAATGLLSLPMRKDLQLMLFTADSATGQYLSAIKHYRQYNILKDSILNDKKSKQIEELQIQYQTEKKEKEIILLNEQKKLQENQLQQSFIFRNFTILGVLLLAGFFYYRYSAKQKSNRKLQLQQIEINQKNKTLQNLVNEKEWLLREIHHRVKNNLQVIMALLESQSTYLQNDSPALKAIQDSQHRVHSMSLIHKKLYKSDNFSSINMLVYIHELVDYLRDSFHTEQTIYFNIDVDKIDLDTAQAVPLGLILSEAITNSIKYAFPGIEDPKISILMKEISAGNLQLQISDNGIGFPADIDISQLESLGLSLMKGLSQEIDGIFSIESKQGTMINIQFPIKHQAFSSKNHITPLPVSKTI